jgi:hypothetical protein
VSATQPLQAVRCSRWNADGSAPYNYNALFIGIIILSFGVGSIIGSFVGGKWSDVTLRRLKKANGGVMIPEVSPISRSRFIN